MGTVQLWAAAVLVGTLLVVAGGCLNQQEIQPSDGRFGSDTGMDQATATDREGERDVYVDVEAMKAIQPGLQIIERNPFLFGTDSRTGAVGDSWEPPQLAEPSDAINTVESTGDGLSLRFIGIVEAPKTVGRIAVLTDGRSVFQGAEGDTLEGRYRITDISGERVEIEVLPAGKREVLYREGV